MQGYNPNWGGLLQAGQNQSQMLGQLGSQIGNQLKARREAEQLQSIKTQAADLLQSGDADAIAEFSLQNPQMGQLLQQQMQYKSDATKQNMTDSILSILANPEKADATFQNRLSLLEANQADPAQTMAAYEEFKNDPDAFMNNAKIMLAYQDPKAYQAYKSTQPEQKKYQYAGNGFVFDPSTGGLAMDSSFKQEMLERQKQEAAAKLLEKPQGETLDFSDVRGLNSDVSKVVDPAIKIHESANALSSLNSNTTAADAQAMIFKFMKALDPDSVVMEGEQRSAVATGGAADSFVSQANHIFGGGKLSPAVRTQFVNTAKKLANSASQGANTAVTDMLSVYGDTLDKSVMDKLIGRVPTAFDMPAQDDAFNADQSAKPMDVRQAQSGYEAAAMSKQAPQVDSIMAKYGY